MKNRNQLVLAIILIFLGSGMLLSKFISIPEVLFTTAIGVVFLTIYYKSGESYANRKLWPIIAGSMVIATGITAWIDELEGFRWLDDKIFFDLDGLVFFVLIGLGFMAVDYVHLRHFTQGKKKSWAFVVGVICMLFGVFTAGVDIFERVIGILPLDIIWPVALIGAGAIILFQNYKSKEKQ